MYVDELLQRDDASIVAAFSFHFRVLLPNGTQAVRVFDLLKLLSLPDEQPTNTTQLPVRLAILGQHAFGRMGMSLAAARVLF